MRPDITSKRAQGLTMVEILVVSAILIVLVGIGVPSFRLVKANARSTVCAGKLREIGVGLNAYFADHGMTFPELVASRESKDDEQPALDTVLLEYVGDEYSFQCPADHVGHFAKSGSSYFWNSLVNGQKTSRLEVLGLPADASGVPLVSDKDNFHEDVGDGVNVLYADGHVLREVKFVVGNR